MRVALGVLAILCGSAAIGALGQVHATSCYSRVYTLEHLSRHPDQLVTSMALELGHLQSDKPWWGMLVTLRGQAGEYYTAGLCDRGPNLSCGVECGGGRIGVKVLSSSAYVYLEPPLGSGSLSLSACEAQEGVPDLRSGKGRQNLLARTSAARTL